MSIPPISAAKAGPGGLPLMGGALPDWLVVLLRGEDP
jgi:hypothetical protein